MLTRLYLAGFKSISAAKPMDLRLGKINVLLGANGSGKSNLLSLFVMLNHANNGMLQSYVAMQGAPMLLHHGPQATSEILARLSFADEGQECGYALTLKYGLPDRLYIADEYVDWTDERSQACKWQIYSDAAETGLRNNLDNAYASMAFKGMTGVYAFQFNNTAVGSPIRLSSGVYDCAALRNDGGNLAAYLRQLKTVEEYQPYYRRIVALVRSVVPQFWDFRLDEVNNGTVWLTWQDRIRLNYVCGPQQFSDGSIRFIALAAALLSPPKLMPQTILLDEPELGLHPHAIDKLVGMIKIAGSTSQVIVATQAPRLVDGFEPEQIRLMETDRAGGGSVVVHPDTGMLSAWIGKYSTSELWEKNVLSSRSGLVSGGRG